MRKISSVVEKIAKGTLSRGQGHCKNKRPLYRRTTLSWDAHTSQWLRGQNLLLSAMPVTSVRDRLTTSNQRLRIVERSRGSRWMLKVFDLRHSDFWLLFHACDTSELRIYVKKIVFPTPLMTVMCSGGFAFGHRKQGQPKTGGHRASNWCQRFGDHCIAETSILEGIRTKK